MASAGPKLVAFHQKNEATEFEIDVEKCIVFARFGKKMSVDDIRSYTERLKADPAFNRTFSEIVDLRKVEDLALKAADFLKIADEIDCFSTSAWRAFVVHNSVQDHAARIHAILRPKGNTCVFTTLEEATAWIESRPADAVPPQ